MAKPWTHNKAVSQERKSAWREQQRQAAHQVRRAAQAVKVEREAAEQRALQRTMADALQAQQAQAQYQQVVRADHGLWNLYMAADPAVWSEPETILVSRQTYATLNQTAQDQAQELRRLRAQVQQLETDWNVAQDLAKTAVALREAMATDYEDMRHRLTTAETALDQCTCTKETS